MTFRRFFGAPASALVAGALLVVLCGAAGAQAPVAQCAPPAAPDPMPESSGHDHTDETAHRFRCRLEAVATLDLKGPVPEPEMFGEVDIAGDRVVMATTFPEAGFVIFDVADPAEPRVLGRFRGPRCETETDLDCGADVKLAPDGRVAFLAVQRSGSSDRPEGERVRPGIVSVDISDPARPAELAFAPVPPVGVHMMAVHRIADALYVFARSRGLGSGKIEPGVAVFRVTESHSLARVSEIVTPGAHDVSLYDDPVDRTTYLFVSGAQSGALLVYDVGDPSHPNTRGLIGRWAPKAEVAGNVWYMHNSWTFRDRGRRFTFVGPELYRSFPPLKPGHGSVPGPLWLLDTTDFAAMRVVGEWRNPGGHPAGDLTLSPHNTWYAGGGITWTSHYHGGVWVLDWNEVLAGRARRPREAGYAVPSSAHRDFVTSDAKDKFITGASMRARPLVWDVVVRGDYGFASDINGGFVVLRRTNDDASSTPSPSASSAARARSGRASASLAAIGVVVAAAIGSWLLIRRRRAARPRRPSG